MLKNVPKLINGDLLKILNDMGHGDTIVLADANFPAASQGTRVVYTPGADAVQMMDAILRLMPLDQYVDCPVQLMAVNPGDSYVPDIWDDFKATVLKNNGETKIEFIDRFSFYDCAKQAFAVVSTGEERLYGCAILKKGVLKPGEAV
ncbi:MAG: RbsD/FucU domain-containing protein [Firmicutes bacterium]|nr:RbsD/FucU domain-containing protein [Bacillota bacterium]